MRSGLVHTAAWLAATGAAGALTWFGVHTALSGTAYDPPRALAVSGDAGEAKSTHAASPTPSPPSPPPARPSATSSSPAPPSSSPSRSPSGPVSSGKPPAESPSTAAGEVQTRTVPGGRVALDLWPESAKLVSATPDPGWRMQVWDQPEWIRVDFSRDGRTSSVFVTWNGHPPAVQTVEG